MKHNLIHNKFSAEYKRWILDKIQQVIDLHGCIFVGVTIDELGSKFQSKLSNPHSNLCTVESAEYISSGILGEITYNLALDVSSMYKIILEVVLEPSVVDNCVSTLTTIHHRGSYLEQTASRFLETLFCSTYGSMTASSSLYESTTVSLQDLSLLFLDLDSDVASSRLKLASVYYCMGDWDRAEVTLKNVTESYDKSVVEAICSCYQFQKSAISESFDEYSEMHSVLSFNDISAFCIRFLPTEIHCAPHELQYEMFRSTPADIQYRRRDDCWMDWAVVDSLPYLYFLQYKTYGHLQRYDDQQQALNNLIETPFTWQNFGHRETALNLLAQCMEQKHRPVNALLYFAMSLNMRRRNNVANIHICRLLNSMLRPRYGITEIDLD